MQQRSPTGRSGAGEAAMGATTRACSTSEIWCLSCVARAQLANKHLVQSSSAVSKLQVLQACAVSFLVSRGSELGTGGPRTGAPPTK